MSHSAPHRGQLKVAILAFRIVCPRPSLEGLERSSSVRQRIVIPGNLKPRLPYVILANSVSSPPGFFRSRYVSIEGLVHQHQPKRMGAHLAGPCGKSGASIWQKRGRRPGDPTRRRGCSCALLIAAVRKSRSALDLCGRPMQGGCADGEEIFCEPKVYLVAGQT
jgi:hypothetical protein